MLLSRSTTCSPGWSSTTPPTSTSPSARRRSCASTVELERIPDERQARRRGDARPDLRHPLHRAAEDARGRAPARLRLRGSGPRPLPRQRLLPARERRRRLPPDPRPHPHARGAPDARAPLRALREAARPRARDRADRLGQVDDARGARRPHQPHALGAHPHDRGSDRVPALAPQLHRQPARDRLRRDDRSPTACAPRCARTPT